MRFFKIIILLLFVLQYSCGNYNNNIIGTPIVIDNLQIAQFDFPTKMKFFDAEKACSDLGDGWRLPSIEEQRVICQYKGIIGGFVKNNDPLDHNDYWSSTDFFNNNVWTMDFLNCWNSNCSKGITTNYVRAVKYNN